MTSKSYTMDIRPLMVLKNCLPVTIYYALDEFQDMTPIESGQVGHLQSVRPGDTHLHLKFYEFREMDWSCTHLVEIDAKELETWRFLSESTTEQGGQMKLDLGVNSVISHGTRVLSIYAPFWMINKTGKNLTYRDGQDSQNKIFHPYVLNEVCICLHIHSLEITQNYSHTF